MRYAVGLRGREARRVDPNGQVARRVAGLGRLRRTAQVRKLIGAELVGVEAADDELAAGDDTAARARRARGQGESRGREGNWQED